jgi:hypothetical protein
LERPGSHTNSAYSRRGLAGGTQKHGHVFYIHVKVNKLLIKQVIVGREDEGKRRVTEPSVCKDGMLLSMMIPWTNLSIWSAAAAVSALTTIILTTMVASGHCGV